MSRTRKKYSNGQPRTSDGGSVRLSSRKQYRGTPAPKEAMDSLLHVPSIRRKGGIDNARA